MYLQVARPCCWAILLLDVSNLNEILRKNRINKQLQNTGFVAHLETNRRLQFPTVTYHQTDSSSPEHHLEFQVLKIAFFGTLGAAVNKEMS